MLPIFIQSDDLHGNMAGCRVLLELAQHRPAQHVRQEHIQRDRGGLILARQRQSVGAALGDQHLEAVVVRQVHQHAGVVRIVLHDQQHRVVRLQVVAVVRQSARSAAPPAHGVCDGIGIGCRVASIAGARECVGPT